MLSWTTVVPIDILVPQVNPFTRMPAQRSPRSEADNPPAQETHDTRRADRLYGIVGGRVRKQREELALTQDVLAQRAGIARTSLTNFERGRQHLPIHVLLRLADELGLELGELIPHASELVGDAGHHPEPRVPVNVGGEVRLFPPRTATAISNALESPSGKNREAPNGTT